MVDIGLQSEYVFSVFGIMITNTFFTTLLVTVVLAIAGILFVKAERRANVVAKMLRVLVYELLKLCDAVTGDRALSKKILPLIATFFIFILTANLLALVPGFLGAVNVHTADGVSPLVRSPNSDLTTTLALALFSVTAIQYFSMRTLGFSQYVRRFLNFKNPLSFIMGFFDMLSEGVKVLSFSFRLFGNVFAGEVLLLVIGFLVPYIVPLPFMILEVFVGIIQAFIFAMLTLMFIKTSIVRYVSEP